MSTNTDSALMLACPGCRKKLRVPVSTAGKKCKCPACETVFKVPEGRSPSAPVVTALPPVKDDLFDNLPNQLSPDLSALDQSLTEQASRNQSPALLDTETSTYPDLSQPGRAKSSNTKNNHPFRLEKFGLDNGALGGLAMMGIAVAWFVVGLMFDRIFFYPPVLFIIGIFGFIKGLMTGHIGGRR